MGSESNIKSIREQWSGSLGFILAATGAAVGLGNIWKFPYMVGSDGGSSFVLVYLICVLLIGIPIMIAEILIGRLAQKNPIDSLKNIAKQNNKSRGWQVIGWWGMCCLMLTLSFYCVVAGWTIYYLVTAILGGLNNLSAIEISSVWGGFLASPSQLIKYQLIFICMTFIVVGFGVNSGIEKVTKILMPLLFIVLIFLVIYSAANMGAYFHKAAHFLFDFRIHQIDSGVIIDAMGHAFFTLAIGVGAMCAYGSYLPKRVSIVKSVFIIVILDVLVAICSGLAIYPVIFMHNLSASSGPGLMFMTLPVAFSDMEGGRWLESLFFLLLLFAAWASAINISEPMVAALSEKTSFGRVKSSIIIAIIAFVIGLLSVFSFNILSDYKLFGKFDLFTSITDLVTNIMLPVGGVLFSFFAGWIMYKKQTKDALNMHISIYSCWLFLIRYFAPVCIIIVLINAIMA